MKSGSGGHRGWQWVRRALVAGFFAVVAWLLWRYGRQVDWHEVGAALVAYPGPLLAGAAALAAASYAVYCTYDLLGRRWTGHRLPVRQVVPVTFVSYAFNLNLGSLIGGFAFRYRLYSRLGLDRDTITRVLGLSLVTNWLGYLVLAGVLAMSGQPSLPADWNVSAAALRLLGGALLVVAGGYLLLCATRAGREWYWHGHHVVVPPLRMALLQLGVSMLNWALIAALIWLLLRHEVDYPVVLGVLLAAAVAGVLTHIPAGLGVLEAVFIALLGAVVSSADVLAALLAYRAVYHLAPLLVALAVYLWLETRAGKEGQHGHVDR